MGPVESDYALRPPHHIRVVRGTADGLDVRVVNRISAVDILGTCWCTVVAGFITYQVRAGEPDAVPLAMPVTVLVWLIIVGIVVYHVWFACSTTTLRLEADHLTWQRRGLGYRRTTVVSRADIQAVVQGRDNADQPGGSLVLQTDQGPVAIVSEQPIDACDWLGSLLARWAAVPLVPATERGSGKRRIVPE